MPEVVRRRHKRPRPQTSCRVCHQRKVRCNRELPCDQCVKHRCAQDCQFDGIPAKQGDAPNTPSWSSTGSVSRGSEDGSFFSEHMPNLGHMYGPNAGLEYHGYGDESTSVKSNEGSRLPTHKWSSTGLTRGRTHYRWLLNEFRVLKQHVDRAASDTGDGHNWSLLVRRKHDLLRQRLLEFGDVSLPSNVYEELPPVAVCCDLIFRYFETFDILYPIMDRDEFGKSFNSMLADPTSVSMCFVIQVLMMQALANATHPDDQAPIPRSAALRWLDLAASTPGSATEIDELDVEMVRLYALAVLARQVLKYNETRDDILASTCARVAMTLGLHRIRCDGEAVSATDRNLCTLWEVIQDLEIQACLAAGMPPSTPFPDASHANPDHEARKFHSQYNDNGHENRAGNAGTGMSGILSSSLAIRHQIVTVLNTETDLRFENVVRLSRELTRAMAPVSTLEHLPDALKTFEYQYVSFVYGRFLTALHRPFATMGDPAFYWSRTLCVRLSKQYMQELFSTFQRHDRLDAFSNLLAGHGTMFRVEALHAIMVLCYELYRDDSDGMGMESMVQPEEDGKMAIKRMLEDFLPFGEKMTQIYELEGRSFVIPFMVLAHLDAVTHVPRNSEAYNHALARAAAVAVDQCFNFWSQLDLQQSGLT